MALGVTRLLLIWLLILFYTRAHVSRLLESSRMHRVWLAGLQGNIFGSEDHMGDWDSTELFSSNAGAIFGYLDNSR
jgi:hypothetical protein